MSDNLKPENSRYFRFGMLLSLILIMLGIFSENKSYFLSLKIVSSYVFYVLSFLLVIVSFFFKKLLRLPYEAWISIGYGLGKVTSPIILMALYFFVITPFAVLCRLLGRDVLKIRSGIQNSYWVDRAEKIPHSDSFLEQY